MIYIIPCNIVLGVKDFHNNKRIYELGFYYKDSTPNIDTAVSHAKDDINSCIFRNCYSGDGTQLTYCNPIRVEIGQVFVNPADFSHLANFEYGVLPNNPPNDIQLVSTIRKRIGRYRDELNKVVYLNIPEPINTSEKLEGEAGIFPILNKMKDRFYIRKGNSFFRMMESLDSNFYVERPKRSK